MTSLLSPGPSRVMGESAEIQFAGMPVTPKRKLSSCTPIEQENGDVDGGARNDGEVRGAQQYADPSANS